MIPYIVELLDPIAIVEDIGLSIVYDIEKISSVKVQYEVVVPPDSCNNHRIHGITIANND